MKFIIKFICNSFMLSGLQLLIAYVGWNMTAVTIVSSSLNSMGLFLIILAVFLRDIVHGIIWTINKLGLNNE